MNIKLEDLEIDGYKIYQDKDSFNFGIDAVLLSNFALRESSMLSKNISICDMCSGTLPIPIIMYAKRKKFFRNVISMKIDAFEIDENQVKISYDSLKYNNENLLDAKNILDDIHIYKEDINNLLISNNDLKEKYDIITCNPPYIKSGSGILNNDEKKNIAKHEININLDTICKCANILLKSNKKFYMIHRTERFTEIVKTLAKYNFSIKKVAFVYPFIKKQSNLFLIEAVKGGKDGIKVLSPIIIYNDDYTYTEDVLKIYGK